MGGDLLQSVDSADVLAFKQRLDLSFVAKIGLDDFQSLLIIDQLRWYDNISRDDFDAGTFVE